MIRFGEFKEAACAVGRAVAPALMAAMPIMVIAMGFWVTVPRVAAADGLWFCTEGGSEGVCSETTSCAGLPWNTICTTKYKNWDYCLWCHGRDDPDNPPDPPV